MLDILLMFNFKVEVAILVDIALFAIYAIFAYWRDRRNSRKGDIILLCHEVDQAFDDCTKPFVYMD